MVEGPKTSNQPWRPLLHLEPLTPRSWNHQLVRCMRLPPMHAHRMSISNVPIQQVLMEIRGWTVVRFWLVLASQTFDMQLARYKLGNKNTPQSWWPMLPCGLHGALPQRRHIQISANMLCNKSMSLKLENIIVFPMFISYLKAWRTVDTPFLCLLVAAAAAWWNPTTPKCIIHTIGPLESIANLRVVGFKEMSL